MGNRGHGEGSIYQRSDGRWAASITLDGGNRKRKTFYGKTRKEVQEKLRVALNEQKQGTLATGPKQTLEVYLTNWLAGMERSLRASTYQQYRSSIKVHLIPSLGKTTLQKLTPEQVDALYTQKRKEGLSPSSIKQMHNILHKALDNAVRWNYVSRNVVDLVASPRVKKYDAQALNPEQAQLLVSAARGNRIEAMLIVAITSGARLGELTALRWTDVNLDSKVMYIHHAVTRIGGRGFVESEPKTKSSKRRVMLADIAVEALKEHRLRQDQARLQAGEKWVERQVVFANIYGNFMQPDVVRRWLWVALEDAGLPKMRFHDLRHSAATILLVMGVHPKKVQELLGHSSITMTMDRYTHVLPAMQQEVVDRMDDVFKRQ